VIEPWAFSSLVATLHDADARVREKAVTALGTYGADAVDPVLGLLRGETRPEVLVAAADVLGLLAEPRGLSPLEGMLADADPRVRRAAAVALGQMGGEMVNATLRRAASIRILPYAQQPSIAWESSGPKPIPPRRSRMLSLGTMTRYGPRRRISPALSYSTGIWKVPPPRNRSATPSRTSPRRSLADRAARHRDPRARAGPAPGWSQLAGVPPAAGRGHPRV
jgi:hypothetical protein